jgi:hypothetical protein
MADHLTLVVRAGTAGDAGGGWVSALSCQRRPGHRACPGHMAVSRTDIPASIHWRCTSCGDEGIISGWEGSPFDLRPRRPEAGRQCGLHIVIPPEVAATLQSLVRLDSDCERLVFRATASNDDIILNGDEAEIDELIGYVAAEANHDEDRRRQKRLDTAFTVLSNALDESQGR